MGLMKLMAMGGPYKAADDADDHADYTRTSDDAHYDRRARKQEKRQRMKRVNRHKTESNL